MTKTDTMVEIVRGRVKNTCEDIVADYVDEPETDRETLIERMDEECDTLFCQLVGDERISEYDVDDLIATAPGCSVIIKTAESDAWVEDDRGLWEGLTFGILASIAFYSLRNLLYQKMCELGYDSNDEYPFEKELTDDEE